jgi:hypothetical protein
MMTSRRLTEPPPIQMALATTGSKKKCIAFLPFLRHFVYQSDYPQATLWAGLSLWGKTLPFDRAEVVIAQKGVDNADDLLRLVSVCCTGLVGVPGR